MLGTLWVGFLLAGSVGWVPQYDFTNYNVEQGLAHSEVLSLLEDEDGDLWIGTEGGGVSRFDGTSFTRLGVRDGLSDHSVLAMLRDRSGAVWLGTRKGACRFDGRHIACVGAEDGLVGEAVDALAEDRRGGVWLGTEKGACLYDGRRFASCLTAKDGLVGGGVHAILQDREGDLWFATDAGGVLRYDGRRFTALTPADGLGNETVFAIAQDKDGILWFGTYAGLSRYDGRKLVTLTQRDGLAGNLVKSILADRQGRLWIGTDDGGLSLYDGSAFQNFTEANGLASKSVWSLLEDREGNLWIGTYRGGLDRYRPGPFSRLAAGAGGPEAVVRGVHRDRRGALWLATPDGLVRLGDNAAQRFTKRDGLVDDFVLAIFEDRAGRLWFGTRDGVSSYDGREFRSYTERDGLAGRVIRAIAEDRSGNLWFGASDGGLSRFDGAVFRPFRSQDGLVTEQVWSLCVAGDGTLLVGTRNGVVGFDGQRFRDLSVLYGLRRDAQVYAIVKDDQGGLWFGEYGTGLARWSPAAPTRTDRFSTADGLPGDNIVSLVLDHAGGLWIGTEAGVGRLDLNAYRRSGEKRIVSYGRDSGFIGGQCIHGAAHRDRDGTLWFGTLRGAVHLRPDAQRPPAPEPAVSITGLRLFFEPADWKKLGVPVTGRYELPSGLTLAHDQNHVAFDFKAVSLGAASSLRYRYQLVGLDKGWSPPTRMTQAAYASLPPGRYSFRVQASTSGSFTAPEALVAFQVAAPFWRRPWFAGLAALVALGLGQVLVSLRTRSIRARQHRLETEVAARTAQLAAEKQRSEEANAALTEALAEIKTLSGLLPICASCKRIRDDAGLWQEVETYVASHSAATFTHGICPSCIERLYPGHMRRTGS